MGFEASQFGDGSASGAGNVTTQVSNHYGTRDSKQAKGNIKTEGVVNELSIEFEGAEVSAGAYDLLAPTLPAGAIIEHVWLYTKEVFTLGGTAPVVDIGTEGSEATNGFTMSEANLETVQWVDLTSALSGTWAAPLAAETTIGILLGGGGSNTSAATGKAEVVIRYSKLSA
jgi:hypothetical protein